VTCGRCSRDVRICNLISDPHFLCEWCDHVLCNWCGYQTGHCGHAEVEVLIANGVSYDERRKVADLSLRRLAS
jgi:hypothetical protein